MNFESGGHGFLPIDPKAPQSFPGVKSFFVNGGVGSDSYDGSRANPFETIGRAIMAAKDWEGKNNVVVDPGYYSENLTIDDFGGIMIRGNETGDNRVFINGSGSDVLNIVGGSEVDLRNLRFKNGWNGVNATNLEKLNLHNIFATDNENFGLNVEVVDVITMTNSNFSWNGATGARIYDSGSFNVYKSYFQNNAHNGMALLDNGHANLFMASANFNGGMAPPPLAAAASFDPGHGIVAYGNDSVVLRRSDLNENYLDGGHFIANGDVSLFAVHALDNQQNGIGGFENVSTLIRDGQFRNNYENGIGLDGGNGSFPTETIDGEGYSYELTMIGGLLWDNLDEGLHAEDFDRVSMQGTDVRRNGYDGVDVVSTDQVWMSSVFTSWNGDDGVDLDYVAYNTLNYVTALHNDGDGFDLDDGAFSAFIKGGNFSSNGEAGIDLDGNFWSRIHNLDIQNAVAQFNQLDGLSVDHLNYGSITGGSFSNNMGNGIHLFDAGMVSMQSVVGYGNSLNGVFSTAGFNGDAAQLGEGEGDEPNGDYNFAGSLELTQSYFNHNGENGVHIEGLGIVYYGDDANFYGGFNFLLDFDRVVARKNGGTGVLIGEYQEREDEEERLRENQGFGYGHVNVEINFNRGSYGFNEANGIQITTGQSLSRGYGVNAAVDVFRAIADFNGDAGLGVEFSGNGFRPPSANGNGYSSSSLSLDRAVFNDNGYDGVSVVAFGDGGNGSPLSYPTVISDSVIAKRNGGRGLNYYYENIGSQQPGLAADEEYEELPLLNVVGGVYNNNGYDGINAYVYSGFVYGDNIGYSMNFEDVIAKNNGENGLRVYGDGFLEESDESLTEYGPVFAVQANVTGGVYNSNDYDGIHLQNISDAILDGVVGNSNSDDGVEAYNVGYIEITDSVFVNNQGLNTNIH